MGRPRKNAPVNRPTRLHSDEPRNPLTFTDRDPNFVYRVFNDVDGRVEHFEKVGYEVVQSKETLGDVTAESPHPVGAAVTRPVGGGVTGVLMRIPREWYEEDQARKQKRPDEIDEALRQESKQEGRYGEVRISRR